MVDKRVKGDKRKKDKPRWVRMSTQLYSDLHRLMKKEHRISFSNMVVHACQTYVDQVLYTEQPKKEALK